MKTKILIQGVIAAAAIGLFFSSCKKDDSSSITPPKPNAITGVTKVATENASAEAAFADAFRQVDKAIKESNKKDPNSCPTVTFTPADLTFPKDLIIDFGTSCTGDDGVIRSGKILAHLTKSYTDSGSVTTITFDNFFVNSHQITGTEIITNMGKNLAGHHVFDVVVQNGNFYSPDGITAYNSVQQREWIEGDSTLLDPMDDVYLITGTADGVTTDGTPYTVTITSALRVAVGCAWVESGTLNITQAGIPVITLDYGTGNCDNIATATCSGYTVTINM